MLLPHNQETYNKIVKLLDSGINNFCLVQGMGVGKSFIFLELAYKNFWNKKILYVLPKYTLKSNMEKYEEFKYASNHIDFITYNKFSNDDAILENFFGYDVFVIDESHHMGSQIYGKNTQTLLQLVKTDKSKYFIGLTATPIRDSDKKNTALFFDEVVYGKSTLDCIEEGLMPQIQFVICSPEIEQIERQKYNIKIDYENSTDLLSSIINDNRNITRWLCYYGTIKDLKNNRETIQNLFPDYKIIEITSASEDVQNSIDDIKDDEKVVICSVDKLLEGIHLPNMLGVLLFRRVHSLTVFTQIFGRITSIGQTQMPLFIDCTDTATRLLNKLLEYNPNPVGTLQGKAPKSRPILNVELKNKKYFDITTLLLEQQNQNGKFDKMVDLINKYMDEHNCNINEISCETVYHGENIGRWLVNQKRYIRELPEQMKREIGLYE